MRGLLAILLMTSGCTLFFEGGKGGDVCLLDQGGSPEPRFEPAPLRNPETLTCESFGGGCNPECGPCPELAELAPIPSWGFCGSACESLDESACAASAECRVVKDAFCAIAGDCVTDFLGCFPIDGVVDPALGCSSATDGWTCSRSAQCTAFHRNAPCEVDGQCPREFALCMPEGASPGRCFDPVACDALPPPCPSGTVPGVIDLCFSGACIPEDLCEKAL
jgi:hypothetical protein